MYPDTHGVPSYEVSGVASTDNFVLAAAEHGARTSVKFATGAMVGKVLVKAGVGGVMELVTAATDTVFGVLVEPKPAGALSFYVYTHATINRDLLDLTAMGIADADLDELQASNSNLIFTRPITSGAV